MGLKYGTFWNLLIVTKLSRHRYVLAKWIFEKKIIFLQCIEKIIIVDYRDVLDRAKNSAIDDYLILLY